MVHARFALNRWVAMFPLARLREEAREFVEARALEFPKEYPSQAAIDRHVKAMSPGGEMVTGPREIAVIEQLRIEALTASASVPTDVFVLAKGEPANRAVTKIGGLPYRSAHKAWPISEAGEPLAFIAQLCFADSRDIVGDLPGDILRIFGDEDLIVDNDSRGITFEWADIGHFELAAERQESDSHRHIEPCYGEIHRTVDFPDQEWLFAAYQCPYQIAVVEGTKIGGAPRWIQGPEVLPGTFLCVLGSVNPLTPRPFPFINSPDLVHDKEDQDYLTWGDVGSVYIFITTDGTLRWTCQYY